VLEKKTGIYKVLTISMHQPKGVYKLQRDGTELKCQFSWVAQTVQSKWNGNSVHFVHFVCTL